MVFALYSTHGGELASGDRRKLCVGEKEEKNLYAGMKSLAANLIYIGGDNKDTVISWCKNDSFHLGPKPS